MKIVTVPPVNPEVNINLSWEEAELLRLILELVKNVNGTENIKRVFRLNNWSVTADTDSHTKPVQKLGRDISDGLHEIGVLLPS